MTSVLPAWKLELIEKKRKKEQDERQKLEGERSRQVTVPEWKRSLLEKKKEGARDSPETRDKPAGLSVNSVFGPRIVRKTSEKTLAIVSASQRPVSEVDEEENSRRKSSEEYESRNHGSPLYSSPADSNSCVTKAVEIPTKVERKSNKQGSLQREVVNNRESSQRSDVRSPKEDLKVSVTADGQFKTKVDNEHVKAPSVVLSYKRMFEQSKPENKKAIGEPRIVKSTENVKADARIDKRTTESKLDTANDKSELLISNKSVRDNAQSIRLEESTSSQASVTNELKTSTPPPSIAPKPFKSYISTPPWLKNASARSVSFQSGERSFQELVVANVDNDNNNNDVGEASKDFLKSDQKSVDVREFDGKEKPKKTLNHGNLEIPGSASEPERRDQLESQTVQKYSIVKESDVKEEQLSIKPGKESESMKYVVISSRNQLESAPLNETAMTVVDKETVSQVPDEMVPHEDKLEETGDIASHKSSVDSLRSKFGPSVGFRRRTSSEENIFLKASQSEPIKSESVLRRPGQSKRTQPDMVRWSADVLSLMSQPIDDDDDGDDMSTSRLSPRSASRIPSANSSQAKRPPPPMKRWTADVLSVVSQSNDSDTSNLSPRSDSDEKSSPSNSLTRARSSSLTDIREEQGCDYFQHKPNVSQGIEHRMHKLIRKVSISETNLNDIGGDSDSLSDDDSAHLNDVDLNSKEAPDAQATLNNEIPDHTLVDTTIKEKDSKPPSFSPEPELQPAFARKHSISHDIEHRLCELFHRQVSQQSDGGESEGEKIAESDGKINTIDKVPEFLPEKLKAEPAPVEKSTDFVVPAKAEEEEVKEDFDHVTPEDKPSKGSVHKLSALFGSSIWKPNKKNKGKSGEKPKDKAPVGSRPQEIPYVEKTNLKGSAVKKEDSKKSSLFSKSQKTEGKSEETKEKELSNTNIFPWFKKRDKDKEKSGESKTADVESRNKKNSISRTTDESSDALPIAVHGLRPVPKTEKVEQRLVGKVMIISNASHEQAPPKGVYHKPKANFQLPEKQKEKSSAEKTNIYPRPVDIKGNEPQIPTIVTQHWNGDQKSPELVKSMEESVPITSIDEVPVSAIDIPESSDDDVTVSVIDVPASPDVHSAGNFVYLNGSTKDVTHTDDDVSVSVIDLPSPVAKEDEPNTFQGGHLEADEWSDGSDSSDEVEGSYDFATGEVTHQMNGEIENDEEDDSDDDEEDDDEDVPISYIGASPRHKVPQVVFDSEPVQLKSCLSPKTDRKKVRRQNKILESDVCTVEPPILATTLNRIQQPVTAGNLFWPSKSLCSHFRMLSVGRCLWSNGSQINGVLPYTVHLSRYLWEAFSFL